MSGERRAAIERAAARLRTLDWYPRPVDTRRVLLLTTPWVFRLPGMRRFHGYAAWNLILLKRPLAQVSDDLVVHELCHVWQMQHHPVAMPLSYVLRGYSHNPNELEARRAAAITARA
ncbi:hypothetical protein [Paraconexibacter algicola]|uniref:DUF4157 domain-containing protein n=1 Tax=Paraconexibacter algicola TaxID=2133960 RepID=A0A2T4UEF7_9ACTN|nr:hypothetical protein [Paraconexibacter algicola]PTL56174.1 hypothetical protein C7Y72_14375 [Paraconexibacter algicola]